MDLTDPPLDPYRCAVCSGRYPVPSLARDCEERHTPPVRPPGPMTAADARALVAKHIY